MNKTNFNIEMALIALSAILLAAYVFISVAKNYYR